MWGNTCGLACLLCAIYNRFFMEKSASFKSTRCVADDDDEQDFDVSERRTLILWMNLHS